LNSGEVVVGKIGDDLPDGLHGAWAYGEPCGTDGTDRGSRPRVPDRAHGKVHRRDVHASGPRPDDGERREGARRRVRAWGRRATTQQARGVTRPRVLAVRRTQRRDGESPGSPRENNRREGSSGRGGGGTGGGKEPALHGVHGTLPQSRDRGLRGARRLAREGHSFPSWSCSAATTASPSRTATRRPARRSPDECSCSTRRCATR
jgi:hypothetical protein